MVNTKCASVLLACIVAATISSSKADLTKQCVTAVKGFGGNEGLAKRAPSCRVQRADIPGCCKEVRQLVAAAPAGCLCNQASYDAVEKEIIGPDQRRLTSSMLRRFSKMCGLKTIHTGTC